MNYEGLKYITGYVAHRFRDKYKNLGTLSQELEPINDAPDWLQFTSRGKLLYPSNELMKVATTMDNEFHKFHGNSLSDDRFIFNELTKRTMEKLPHIDIPYEVILRLSRTRTYTRLRDLNRKISLSNSQRKLERKMSKFTNVRK